MASDQNSSWYSTAPEDAPQPTQAAEKKPVRQWQMTKEKWYDHLNVTVKQLDIFLYCAFGALGVVIVLIVLDALNIIG